MRKEKMCVSHNLGKKRVKPTPAGALKAGHAPFSGGHAPFQQEAQALGQGYAEYSKKDGK